jgi:hypothetical protein
MAKRTRRRKPASPAPSSRRLLVPSAQTLFRLHLRQPEVRDSLGDAIGQASPRTLARDRGAIQRIEAAETIEQLMDLVATASGLSAPAWYRRLQSFGPEIAPLIAQRLRRARQLSGEDDLSSVYEHLLSALGFYGDAGIEAVRTCFDALSDYGKSLACVVLGYLGARESADVLWGFYRRARSTPSESFYVGPLWGLVDLEDPRAADALDELLWTDQYFFECFAMVYRAGDARALLPLMYLFQEGGEALKDPAGWALVGLAHRVGRDALLDQLQPATPATAIPLSQAQALIDLLLRMPQERADAHFAFYFEGFTPDMLGLDEFAARPDMVDHLQSLIAEAKLLEQEPPRPDHMPGRNDPCWCGSGKKYKYCHWRKDRTGA